MSAKSALLVTLVTFITGVIFSSSDATSSDVYTSMEQLKGLTRLETFLSQLLDQHVKNHESVPSVVKRFSEEMKKIVRERISLGVDAFIGHPANVFLLVRRFLKHWTELSKFLEKGPENDLQGILKENQAVFPTSEDLRGCASALLRIQEVYNFTAKQIAGGHMIEGIKGPSLGADECYELGYVTHRWAYFDQAREWLKETLLRMGAEYGYKGALKRVQVLEYLAWAEYQMGDLDEAIKLTEIILEKDPDNKKAKQAMTSYKQQHSYRKAYANNLEERIKANHRQNRKSQNSIDYERLCRGEILQGQPQEKLTCFYKTSHPLLVLKPAKIEVVSLEPEIQILHEAVTDKEIAEIINLGKPKLIRALIVNASSGEHTPVDYRISRSGWLREEEGESIGTLNTRLSAMTSLSCSEDDSELLQVVNYGVGGHYEPHHDYLDAATNPSMVEGRGDRIASILLYLSDVTAGGATVFLHPEVVVYPRKGDAIFWYNLYRSGEADTRTKHGACPVIIGSKWGKPRC